ncbi:MAG: hypothetical protein B7Y80_16525 [Hyphomicrobium sp. 32-62-53]|nr:MAG: hypothetical protein B7Y80_16525 [Hyphomicrobium sp. 32-62-53]
MPDAAERLGTDASAALLALVALHEEVALSAGLATDADAGAVAAKDAGAGEAEAGDAGAGPGTGAAAAAFAGASSGGAPMGVALPRPAS